MSWPFSRRWAGVKILIAIAIMWLPVALLFLRSIGNVSLTVALISTIYAFIFFSGTPLIIRSNYLDMASTGYAILIYMVWLNAYGKFSAKALALSLISWVVAGLWVPAFWLMTKGALPL